MVWFGRNLQPTTRKMSLHQTDHTDIVTGNRDLWQNCHMDMVQPQKAVKAEINWVGVGIRENCHQRGCNLATTSVTFLWCRTSHNHTFSGRYHYPSTPCLPEFQDFENRLHPNQMLT